MTQPIVFVASAPHSSSFVNTKGDGETRVSLIVPMSERLAMSRLQTEGIEVLLRVTVEIDGA